MWGHDVLTLRLCCVNPGPSTDGKREHGVTTLEGLNFRQGSRKGFCNTVSSFQASSLPAHLRPHQITSSGSVRPARRALQGCSPGSILYAPGPVQRALALIVVPGQLCCAYQSKLLLPKLKPSCNISAGTRKVCCKVACMFSSGMQSQLRHIETGAQHLNIHTAATRQDCLCASHARDWHARLQ